jgi:hypothetical protein
MGSRRNFGIAVTEWLTDHLAVGMDLLRAEKGSQDSLVG